MAAAALSFAMWNSVCASPAFAQDDAGGTEAGRHFRRGVDLYGEADYAGALVEFKRAYALSPSSAALYNVGEAQFQMQDYAGALKTFRRFLAEFGPGEGHRAEVERSIDVLRTRVGHVAVTTVPAGADLSVDDQPVGKTPLGESVLVSVGRRKVVASMPGRATITRYIEVAAGDELEVTLPFAAPTEGATAPATSGGAPSSASLPAPPSPPWNMARARTVGWIATGTLAAGAGVFGVLAVLEDRDLKNARSQYPVTNATLTHDSNLTLTYSVLADSLTAAAIIVGGLSLYWTLGSTGSASPARGSAPTTSLALGPAAVRLDVTF
ncbi:MAG TPA: PEGA domain-containing protein [Polyangiaceae bacterium]